MMDQKIEKSTNIIANKNECKNEDKKTEVKKESKDESKPVESAKEAEESKNSEQTMNKEEKKEACKKNDENIEELVQVYLKSGASVSLQVFLITYATQRKLVQTEILVRFKTFHGARKIYEITAFITDSIAKVKSKLIDLDEDKELAQCKQIRFIYPIVYFLHIQGRIKELPSSSTLEYLEIPNNALIVVIGLKTFTWSTTLKGPDIELLNGNTTAKKKHIQDYETILGAISFYRGRHYWEIKVIEITLQMDAMVDPEDIFIGIATESINMIVKPTEGGGQNYWGYICCGKKKFSPRDENQPNYGG